MHQREFLTIGRRHGAKTFEIIAGPDNSAAQMTELKNVTGHPTHPDYAEIQFWEAVGGRSRKLKLEPGPKRPVAPVPSAAPAPDSSTEENEKPE